MLHFEGSSHAFLFLRRRFPADERCIFSRDIFSRKVNLKVCKKEGKVTHSTVQYCIIKHFFISCVTLARKKKCGYVGSKKYYFHRKFNHFSSFKAYMCFPFFSEDGSCKCTIEIVSGEERRWEEKNF